MNKVYKINNTLRHDWASDEAKSLIDQPLLDLIYQAQTIHRSNFPKNEIQKSKLLSIKTGSCPEDCSYCAQSAHHNVDLKKEPLISLNEVIKAAEAAVEEGATRFCMGAAWRGPTDNNIDQVCDMVEAVNNLGLESCVTLGMLKDGQAKKLADSGLNYYNHNIDTSKEFYNSIIRTRKFSDRLDTLEKVRNAGVKVCSGGIIGMGESRTDRAEMLRTLSNLEEHPESIPINMLIRIPGTPLGNVEPLDHIELVRTIALARIMMPMSTVRLSAGRAEMSNSTQALCFLAGASSIFLGDVLLTADNPGTDKDNNMLDNFGLKGETKISFKDEIKIVS
ncbi:MAG: biotin synthase BioB [Pelagibacterales bacterium]|nr:biotin synthase BioB [Pelagibacterales bacterium]